MSYRDRSGLESRANSAMLRIKDITERTDLSSGARLVMIAKVMADEPVLTDDSVAAASARREAQQDERRRRAREQEERLRTLNWLDL